MDAKARLLLKVRIDFFIPNNWAALGTMGSTIIYTSASQSATREQQFARRLLNFARQAFLLASKKYPPGSYFGLWLARKQGWK